MLTIRLPGHDLRGNGPTARGGKALEKIALISNSAASLLSARRSLIGLLREAGLQVVAFAPDFDPGTQAQLLALGAEPEGFYMLPHSTSPLSELRSILSLALQLRRHKPDLCFACFVKPVLNTGIAAVLARVPRRYGLIAGLGHGFARGKRPGLPAFAARLALRPYQGLMFQNAADLRDLTRLCRLPQGRAYLTGGTGVDLTGFALASHTRAAPLPAMARPAGENGSGAELPGFCEPQSGWAVRPAAPEVTFLFAARFLRSKGLEDFVTAAGAVRGTHPSARFVALGARPDHPDAISPDQLAAWKARGVVAFPGHQPVLPWLERADVAVLPSFYREGVPRFLQEALAAGRPVITCDLPGCADAVIAGETGLLIPPQSPEALARAMREFLDRPELIRRFGAAGRSLAKQKFDARQQDRRLLEIMKIPTGQDRTDRRRPK